MKSENNDILLMKDYCMVINNLNSIIQKMIKEEKTTNELRRKDYKYLRNKIKKNDNYFFKLIEMAVNYYLALMKMGEFDKYFKLKNDMYSGYNFEDIPTNYIKASETIDEIIESYTGIDNTIELFEEAEKIAEKIINAKFGIKDSLDQNLFTLDIIYKFSNYNIMNDEEGIEIIWYILLYIATYYNTLNFYK